MFKIGEAVKIIDLPQEVRYTIAQVNDNGTYRLKTPSGAIMTGEFAHTELKYFSEVDKIKHVLDEYC